MLFRFAACGEECTVEGHFGVIDVLVSKCPIGQSTRYITYDN